MCHAIYSDMTTIPVLSKSQWSPHVCACMHRNEMFSNWEKSREGESNGKMRGREEKRREREERARAERVKEGGREGDREREEERGREGWGWNLEKSTDN